MGRFVWVVLTCFGAVVALPYSVGALTSNWLDGQPVIRESIEVTNDNYNSCRYTFVTFPVKGLFSNKNICINDTYPIRLGYYDEGRSTQFVIGFSRDSFVYPIEGLDCDHSCLYSATTDTLIARRNLINGMVKSLVLYKNFSKRIQKIRDLEHTGAYYKLVDTDPSYIFQSSLGYPYPVNGMGLSSNGRYLGFEARSRGFLIMDLQTLDLKRVSDFAYTYNYSNDPSVEIAMSNDGNNLLAVGVNAGLKFYSDIVNCGDEPSDSHIMDLVPMSENSRCKEINIDISGSIDRFSYATAPQFMFSSGGVMFYAHSYNEHTKRIFVASNGAHNFLDYLALGDSYSSGEGETNDSMYFPYTNTQNEKCHTSQRSYPYLLARPFLPSDQVKSVACSGAETIDVLGTGNGEYRGQGNRLDSFKITGGNGAYQKAKTDALVNFVPGRIIQLDFAGEYQPYVLTIGIGGNDVDLVGKLKECIQESTCSYAVDVNARARLARQIDDLYYQLLKTYRSIRQASPRTTMYAVGYPQVISATGNCDALNHLFFNTSERIFMRNTISYINTIIQTAAQNSGVRYIDIDDVFGEATLCGTATELAMNGLTLGDDVGVKFIKIIGNESFHPNPLGHKLIADRINNLFPNMFSNDFCSVIITNCTSETSAPIASDYWTAGSDTEIEGLIVRQATNLTSPNDSLSRSRIVQLDAFSLEPGSNIRVVVGNNRQEVGQFYANSDGSLRTEITLPADLDYGYHNVVVEGKTYSGETVEYRELISLSSPIESTPVADIEADTKPTDDNIPVSSNNATSVGGSRLATQPPPPSNTSLVSLNRNNDTAVLGATDDKSSQLKPRSVDDDRTSSLKLFWLAFLGIGALISSGLIAYLLIRRARFTIKT